MKEENIGKEEVEEQYYKEKSGIGVGIFILFCLFLLFLFCFCLMKCSNVI